MAKKDEFDWLDDPFNDKKASQQQTGMSNGTKVALGCGCLVVLVAVVVLLMFFLVDAMSILSQGV